MLVEASPFGVGLLTVLLIKLETERMEDILKLRKNPTGRNGKDDRERNGSAPERRERKRRQERQLKMTIFIIRWNVSNWCGITLFVEKKDAPSRRIGGKTGPPLYTD